MTQYLLRVEYINSLRVSCAKEGIWRGKKNQSCCLTVGQNVGN